MQSISRQRLLTVDEFAAAVGKRPATIRSQIWKREIDFLRIGRSIRFTEEMAQKALECALVPALER